MAGLVHFTIPEKGHRWGCLIENTVYDITPQVGSLSAWLKTSPGRVAESIQEVTAYAKEAGAHYL